MDSVHHKPTISKEAILNIFKTTRPPISSFQPYLEAIPEMFSNVPIEPENFAPPQEINPSDAFIESTTTPRPMRLVFQKKTYIPKSPFNNSGYADTPTSRIWYYLDERNNVQGPFTSIEMDSWFDQGYFFNELLIRIKENNEFVKLIHLFGKTEITQVYKPVPLGMLDQFNLQQQYGQVPKSAEVKRENPLLSSKPISGKKESIYNFGFDSVKSLQGLSSAGHTPEKIKEIPEEALEVENKVAEDDELAKSIKPVEIIKESEEIREENENVEAKQEVSKAIEEKVDWVQKIQEEIKKVEQKKEIVKEDVVCDDEKVKKEEEMIKSDKSDEEGNQNKANNRFTESKPCGTPGKVHGRNTFQFENERGSHKKRNNNINEKTYEKKSEGHVQYVAKDNGKYQSEGQVQYVVKEKQQSEGQVQYVAKDKGKYQANKQQQKEFKNDKQVGKKTENDYTVEYVAKPKKPTSYQINQEQKKESHNNEQYDNYQKKQQNNKGFGSGKKNQEKVIFLPKKKEDNNTIKPEDGNVAGTPVIITPDFKERVNQESKTNPRKAFERQGSDTYEMLKATSEYYQTSNNDIISSQINEIKPPASAELKSEVFSFNPPTVFRKPREKMKLISAFTNDYEREQDRVVSTSLNLLDLEEKLTPSKKIPTKSTFNSNSLNPSPIIIDQRSVGPFYDFSEDLIYASFDQQGNPISRKI